MNAPAVDAYRAGARYLAERMSRASYARARNLDVYQWQADVVDSRRKRKVVNGARQGGKSTSVVTVPCWTAKFIPGSLSIIGAAVEKQAIEDIEKCKDLLGNDPGVRITRTSDELIYLENGSRILVVPATEKSFRGYSQPRVIVLDEAYRIPDDVYASGVVAMLNKNPLCELILISTPNGREGFFYRAFRNKNWERFEVVSPWTPTDEWKLVAAESENEFRMSRIVQGIRGYISPRHLDQAEQQGLLEEIGPRMYRQEMRCEFVEAQGQLFRYADIEYLTKSKGRVLEASGFAKSGMKALDLDNADNGWGRN